MNTTLPAIAVVGPTGTGKSDLSIALARELGGEIVNADALQFYRGMDIGTAKLPVGERGGVPHHMLDIMDVREEASVARFQSEARRAFDEIRSRGAVPILVGGSGLYVRAALDEIDFPPTDAAVRRRLELEVGEHGPGPLARRLAEVDPASAARNLDERRMIRALEVFEISGKPFSSFMPERKYHAPAVQIGLNVDRGLLHQRLEMRVAGMQEQGLLEEVRRLDAAGLREGKTASRAIGYAQFLAVLDGTMSEVQAAEKTVIATRQFARRQVTWFNADERVRWFNPLSPTLLDDVQATIHAS
ncbi:tRNA (adenosine(37)-N6)-dimethylallyltransferase MiaA [Paeniglutamicibacter sp. R2-26]|uniref:tRNA (adenosine(37)-N6)-dimethylallyltransferase MiaA n=1 Tax=Paeniglutamicibacter sp. R2-26 TaxID=3144417 RepID=UPI003EE7CC1E